MRKFERGEFMKDLSKISVVLPSLEFMFQQAIESAPETLPNALD